MKFQIVVDLILILGCADENQFHLQVTSQQKAANAVTAKNPSA